MENNQNKENNENINLNKSNNSLTKQSIKEKNDTNNTVKRHRRGKNISSNERNFKCPQCDKCYLSAPALTNHKKAKHEVQKNTPKKGRGRPRKNNKDDNFFADYKIKYDNFFNNEKRINKNNEISNLETIENIFEKLFKQYKNELFANCDSYQKDVLFNLIKTNWNLKEPNFDKKCKTSILNSPIKPEFYDSPAIDGILFYYIKLISEKSNKEYLFFVIKFILFLRDFINKQRKEFIKEKDVTNEKKDYSQIYSAETLPDIFNDFYSNFSEIQNFYEMDQNELIEIIQHFCYWMFLNGYTESHLSLTNQ